MPILAAIAVLGVLIFVHELGHFLAARLQGIHVNRFSIGFGPILWKYQGSRTEYALRGLPLGGFVGFPDDDPDSDIPHHDPDLLRNRPLLDRAIVISAGVIANLVFAYFLLVVQVGIAGIPEFQPQPGVLINQVMEEGVVVAYDAGVRPGDVIVAAAGESLVDAEPVTMQLVEIIQDHPNQPLVLKIERDRQILDLTVTPQVGEDGQARIGIELTRNGTIVRRSAQWPTEVLTAGADAYQRTVVLILKGFGQLVLNFGEMADQVAGPVKIVEIGANIAQSDATNLLQFAALISINLAIINILPLPALDGGQLVFLLVEGLRGKPLPAKIQDGVMQTGLMLILGLGLFLIVRDTANLDWVQNLLQD